MMMEPPASAYESASEPPGDAGGRWEDVIEDKCVCVCV